MAGVDDFYVGARTIPLSDMAAAIEPESTVLLLGAGASVPSGAPTGAELAHDLGTKLAPSVPVGDELEEVASILEVRVGRHALVNATRERFEGLRPSGGLLALPEFPWRRIYTTNFDRLVELAYQHARKELAPIRSNFDFERGDRLGVTQLLKIHGCLSQDFVDGRPGRLVLTEFDYDDYAGFREALFRQLDADLMTSDVVIVGQSLADRHLKALMTQAAQLQAQRGAPGRLFAVVYERDEDRAALFHRRGISTSFGGLDEFLYELSQTHEPKSPSEVDEGNRLLLKPVLRTAAIDVDQMTMEPNAVRLFNGRPATYADIRGRLTFRRSAQTRLLQFLDQSQLQFITVVGVAGVGKTTLARQTLLAAAEAGFYGWEYVRDLPFAFEDWLEVDEQLRDRDAKGVLFIDECTSVLGQVNQLAVRLAERGPGGLRLLLTASLSQWRPRRKASWLYARGKELRLSELDAADIERLVQLVEDQPKIRELTDPAFAKLSRSDKVNQLAARAQADMFVCLKNIFAAEALNTILLREYAELDASQQDVYRVVAALQASGGRVHRQMVLRVLNLRADQITGLLGAMEGLVDEYEVSAPLGLYTWETRHEVIARVIAQYSYPQESELYDLLAEVVRNTSPAVNIELRALRDMCNAEFGIPSLPRPQDRLKLFEMMVKVAPRERIPRHRMIREYLDLGELDAAAQTIRAAEQTVGLDRPLQRYKVQLELKRAREARNLAPEHRLSVLRLAERQAQEGIHRYADDKFAFSTYAEVGVAVAEETHDLGTLDDALREMAEASERLLDPALGQDLVRFEKTRDSLRGRFQRADQKDGSESKRFRRENKETTRD